MSIRLDMQWVVRLTRLRRKALAPRMLEHTARMIVTRHRTDTISLNTATHNYPCSAVLTQCFRLGNPAPRSGFHGRETAEHVNPSILTPKAFGGTNSSTSIILLLVPINGTNCGIVFITNFPVVSHVLYQDSSDFSITKACSTTMISRIWPIVSRCSLSSRISQPIFPVLSVPQPRTAALSCQIC